MAIEHNRIIRRCVRKGEVTNVLMRMKSQEKLEQTDNSFYGKIIRAKRTTIKLMAIQDVRTDDGVNDPAEQNEELPD